MNFGTILFPIAEPTETSVTCRHDGDAHHYELPPGHTAEDIAIWYASRTGNGVTHYPIKIGEREYEMTDYIGDPPAELFADDRDSELDAWYARRAADLLTGRPICLQSFDI
jgi:hypothetical protein